MKNRIGWCNTTFNPVWGCRNHCPYCYARTIAKRFWKQMIEIEFNYWNKLHPILRDPFYCGWNAGHLLGLKDFKPIFLNAQFNKKFPKKPQRIFVGSMSEIHYWEQRWMEVVLGRILSYPQHTFQFLTRHPEVYTNYSFPKNCWLGVTIVEGIDSIEWMRFKMSYPDNLKFISLEPLIKQAIAKENSKADLRGIDWVILGAETGKRRGKIIPKKEWIENIIDYCRKDKIPVYLKDSLKGIYLGEIREFPKIN